MDENIEEKILQVLKEWPWEPSKEKIRIELDPKVNRFSTLLFSEENWQTIYKILRKSVNNGKSIYISNYFLPLDDIKHVASRLYQEKYDYILDFVAKYFEQFKNFPDDIAIKINDILKSLLYNDILEETPEMLEYCESCGRIQIVGAKERSDECECGSRIFKIFKCILSSNVKKSLQSNQFLEIYVKEVFKEIGLRVISKEIDGNRVSTSVPYKVPPNPPVEVDVTAVYGDWLFLCECKTGKIVPNDVEVKLNKANRLVKQICKQIGVQGLKVIYVWVTTEEIDRNVQPYGYLEDYDWLKDLLCIDGSRITGLKNELRKKLLSL